MATEKQVCRFCGGHGAFGVTDLGDNRVLVCPACVPADAPTPPAYEVIRAALTEAGLTPPLGHEERMIASIEAEQGRLDDQTSPRGSANALGCVLGLVLLAVVVLGILQIVGVL